MAVFVEELAGDELIEFLAVLLGKWKQLKKGLTDPVVKADDEQLPLIDLDRLSFLEQRHNLSWFFVVQSLQVH